MCGCGKFTDNDGSYHAGIINGVYEFHTIDLCKSEKLVSLRSRFFMTIGRVIYRFFRKLSASKAYPALEMDMAYDKTRKALAESRVTRRRKLEEAYEAMRPNG